MNRGNYPYKMRDVDVISRDLMLAEIECNEFISSHTTTDPKDGSTVFKMTLEIFFTMSRLRKIVTTLREELVTAMGNYTNKIVHPRDEATGRYLCTADYPMPDELSLPEDSYWHHPDSELVKEYKSYEINYETYACPHCELVWTNEVPKP